MLFSNKVKKLEHALKEMQAHIEAQERALNEENRKRCRQEEVDKFEALPEFYIEAMEDGNFGLFRKYKTHPQAHIPWQRPESHYLVGNFERKIEASQRVAHIRMGRIEVPDEIKQEEN